MLQLIRTRLLHALPVLLGVTLVVFVSMQLIPGDAARTILGYAATEERVQALREQLGLNRPWPIQYVIWLCNLLQGDLGRSITMQVPVRAVILDKIGNSLILMLASFVLVVVFGLLLGIIAGASHRKLQDRATVGLLLVFASVPPFWLGLVLLYIFGLQLRWFPISGMYTIGGGGGLLDLLRHLVLPAVTTAVSSLAVVARVTRGGMIDSLQQPYVLAARARGYSRRLIVWGEALRNVLPTFVNISGLQIGYLFGGVIFSEVVFNWPGLGLQLYNAIVQRDVPVIQGCVLAVAIVFVVGNLISDVLVYALDPTRR
ncbi:MAG: ABC transporter permease [Geminicoccaceae bacterium]